MRFRLRVEVKSNQSVASRTDLPLSPTPPAGREGVRGENVRDKFSDLTVLESTPRPGLRPEEVAPSEQF